MRKATNEELLDSYEKTRSIWKTAEKFGMCGQSVWERLDRLDVINKKEKEFTDDDVRILIEKYNKYADEGKLEDLAKIFNKDKTNVVRKAKRFGLTNKRRKKRYASYTDAELKILFEEYKNAKNLRQFCKEKNISSATLWKEFNRLFPDEYERVGQEKLIKSRCRGALHYKWEGGKSLRFYNSPEYHQWRNAVLKRDKYICQHCGGKKCKEKALNAHHIKSATAYPELRTDVNNGLTLCKRCHEKEHSRGRKSPIDLFISKKKETSNALEVHNEIERDGR